MAAVSYQLIANNVLGDDARHSRHPLPVQLRSLCHSFHEVLNRRFPDEALDALGTVLFLRFINPALGNARATLSASALAVITRLSLLLHVSLLHPLTGH